MLCLGKTNVGMKRSVNQDSFKITEFNANSVLAVVCDGMGGAAGGGDASSIASEAFTKFATERLPAILKKKFPAMSDERKIKTILTEAANAANAAVFEAASDDPELQGMGTTLVASLLAFGTLYTVNVGDSRMYLAHQSKLKQITHDHSYVQYLLDTGRITEDEAKTSTRRNIITRAVGIGENVEADVFTSRADAGKATALLCSDGLVNYVSEDEMLTLLSEMGSSPDEEKVNKCLDALIDTANEAGGGDNITAVILCA